jgi:hypothetical protein
MQVEEERGDGILGIHLKMFYETIAMFLQSLSCFMRISTSGFHWICGMQAESTFGIDMTGTSNPLLGPRTVNKHGVPTMV